MIKYYGLPFLLLQYLVLIPIVSVITQTIMAGLDGHLPTLRGIVLNILLTWVFVAILGKWIQWLNKVS